MENMNINKKNGILKLLNDLNIKTENRSFTEIETELLKKIRLGNKVYPNYPKVIKTYGLDIATRLKQYGLFLPVSKSAPDLIAYRKTPLREALTSIKSNPRPVSVKTDSTDLQLALALIDWMKPYVNNKKALQVIDTVLKSINRH